MAQGACSQLWMVHLHEIEVKKLKITWNVAVNFRWNKKEMKKRSDLRESIKVELIR